MGKTAYVASRFASREEVRKIYSRLEKLGYTISYDWTNHKSIKPYENNPELAGEYSAEDMEGARKSDLFILITDEAGTGIHSELGGAIDHYLEFKKPIIYVVGEHLNSSMFFFHPCIKRRATIDDVIKEVKESN
jgi:hypothetical protein